MKSYKNQNEELDKAIDLLEIQRDLKLEELKSQLSTTYESLKPANLLKESIDNIRESVELKSDLTESVLSIAVGYISKKILVGKSSSFFKIILGNLIQYGVTNFIYKKVDLNSTKK
jgi:hypothetical protein